MKLTEEQKTDLRERFYEFASPANIFIKTPWQVQDWFIREIERIKSKPLQAGLNKYGEPYNAYDLSQHGGFKKTT